MLVLKLFKRKRQSAGIFCFVVFIFSFVNSPVRKTMEEKLNEKRQELHRPQISEEDRNAHATAMVLHKDCDK